MTSVVKKISWALLVLLVTLATVVGILLARYHPNDFKPLISDHVSSLTGRKFSIHGDIKWSVFPWFGIKIDQIVLDDAPSSGRDPMLQVSNVAIKIELLPLLKKHIRVSDLHLKDVSLQLIHDAGQDPNWLALKKISKENAQNNRTTPTTEHSKSWFSPDQVRIDHVSVQNANIYFRNPTQNFEIQKFNFSSDKFEVGQPIPIQLAFEINSQSNPLKTKHKGSAAIEINPANQVVTINNMVWDSQIHDDRLPQKDLELQLKTSITYHYNEDSFSIDTFNARVGGADISGKLAISQISNRFDMNGDIKVEGYNPTELMATVRAFTPIALDLESARKFIFLATLSGDRKSLTFKNVSLQAGKTDAQGQMTLRMTEDKNWITFDVSANQIDLAMFDNKNTNVHPTKANAVAHVPQNQNPPRRAQTAKPNLLVEGSVAVQQLIMTHDLSLQQIKADIHLDNNALQVNNAHMNLLGGDISGTIKGVLGDMPEWSITSQISHLPIRPVLEKLGKKPLAQGDFDLTSTILTKGNDAKTLLQNSNGSGQFSLQSGQVTGIDVAYYLQNARALVDKSVAKTDTNRRYTPIDSLIGTFTLTNGVIVNNDLAIRSEQNGVTGKGKIDLTTNILDYGVSAASYSDNGDKKTGRVPLAIKIVGPIDSPSIVPDTQAYMTYFLQQAVQGKVQKLLENKNILNNNIGNELQKALKIPKVLP